MIFAYLFFSFNPLFMEKNFFSPLASLSPCVPDLGRLAYKATKKMVSQRNVMSNHVHDNRVTFCYFFCFPFFIVNLEEMLRKRELRQRKRDH